MNNNYFHLISHHFMYRIIIIFFVQILQCFSTQDNNPDMQILWELLKFTEEYELLLKKGFGIAKICIYFCSLLSIVFNRTNAEVYPGIAWKARFIIQWSNSALLLITFITFDSWVNWWYSSHVKVCETTTTPYILPSHHFHRSSYNIYFCKSFLWFTYLWKN